MAAAMALFVACDFVDSTRVAAPRLPVTAPAAGDGGAGQASFSATVQPMFLKFCSTCHNAATHTAGVDLTSYGALTQRPGLVVAGDPDRSLVIKVLEGGIMPPAGNPKPSAAEIAAVRQWIADGAVEN